MADTGQPAAAAPAADPAPASDPAPAQQAPTDKPAEANPAPASDPKGKANPAKPETALSDPGDKPVAAPADWPQDWRDKMAGDDEKLRKRMDRFKSPKDILDFALNAEKKISSGKIKSDFPADGSDEEKAAWRKDNGIPETPDAYDLTLDDGLVIGDQDKPIVDAVVAGMHEKNASPEQVKVALSTYYKMREEQTAMRAAEDEKEKTTTRDELRDELGEDFRPRVMSAFGLIEMAPEDVREQIMAARLPNGGLLGNNAGVLKWLMQLAEEVNPGATIVPGSSGGAIASIETEIAQIEKLQGDKNSEYWKGAGAEKMQERYRELLTAREKINKKAGKA